MIYQHQYVLYHDGVILPKSIRDTIYNIIAKNRHNIGIILSDDTCRIELDHKCTTYY